MSHRQSRRQHRDERRLCASCQERKAKYQYRRHVRADRQHVLCFQCFRSAREQMRARQLAMLPFDREGEGADSATATARSAPLSPSQIRHRREMLAFLESDAARCAR
jgi:hypothetical protein